MGLALAVPQCLKFKTDQSRDVKRMEKLNNEFLRIMARGGMFGEVDGEPKPNTPPLLPPPPAQC